MMIVQGLIRDVRSSTDPVVLFLIISTGNLRGFRSNRMMPYALALTRASAKQGRNFRLRRRRWVTAEPRTIKFDHLYCVYMKENQLTP